MEMYDKSIFQVEETVKCMLFFLVTGSFLHEMAFFRSSVGPLTRVPFRKDHLITAKQSHLL